MNSKIFCDIADLSSITKFNKKNIVKGFTTNPSLMRKAGAKDYALYAKQILKTCKKKPISFEVFADDQKTMIDQGKKINTWGKNVYVKVPVVNSKNKFMGGVIKELNNQNVKLNITAVYSSKQTEMILKNINKKQISNLTKIFPNKSFNDIINLNKIIFNLVKNDKIKELYNIMKDYDNNIKTVENIIKIDKTMSKITISQKNKKIFNSFVKNKS